MLPRRANVHIASRAPASCMHACHACLMLRYLFAWLAETTCLRRIQFEPALQGLVHLCLCAAAHLEMQEGVFAVSRPSCWPMLMTCLHPEPCNLVRLARARTNPRNQGYHVCHFRRMCSAFAAIFRLLHVGRLRS